jgi:hypothetical protein
MKMLKNLFALSLLCACTLAAAQWQWLDKDGRKVFSDRAPPPDVLDKNIIKRPGGRIATPAAPATAEGTDISSNAGQTNVAASPALPASGAKPNSLEKELEAKKKQAADAEAAKKKAEEEKIAKAKIENCARAKQAKASLDSGARIGRVNAAGEREVMDDAARAAEAKRIQAVMATDCS